jgi:multiple sugar transport system permease protein
MTTSLNKRQQPKVETEAEAKLRARRRNILMKMGTTTLAAVLLAIFLMPMGYALVSSVKTAEQASDPEAPILPSQPATFEYEGKEYDILTVPIDGETRDLALVQPGRQQSEFIDPDNPEAGIIVWEGNWRQLDTVRESA